MEKVSEKIENLLGIEEKNKLGKEVLSQISSIDVEKIQSLIKQIANLKKSPLVFIKMNSEFDEGDEISGRIICMDNEFRPLKCSLK